MGSTADFVAELDDADSSFLLTHVCDVLLWLEAQHRRRVIAEVLGQIVEAAHARLAEDANTRFSLVAHSLGTSVAEVALTALANGEGTFGAYSEKARQFQLAGYVALSNVSRVLNRRAGFYESTRLRPPAPGAHGIARRVVNVHHAIDPFCHAKRFSPSWEGSSYRDVRVEHVHQADVHAFEHYLKHPEVCGHIFWAALGNVSKKSISEAGATFRSTGTLDLQTAAKVEAFVASTEKDMQTLFAGSGKPAQLVGRMASRAWRTRKALKGLGVPG